jgi:hypothetical protein
VPACCGTIEQQEGEPGLVSVEEIDSYLGRIEEPKRTTRQAARSNFVAA